MWLPEDTEAALVWQECQDEVCDGCGQPRSESYNPKGPDYQATALRCRACEARDSEAAKWQRDDNSHTHGLRFAVTPRGGDD